MDVGEVRSPAATTDTRPSTQLWEELGDFPSGSEDEIVGSEQSGRPEEFGLTTLEQGVQSMDVDDEADTSVGRDGVVPDTLDAAFAELLDELTVGEWQTARALEEAQEQEEYDGYDYHPDRDGEGSRTGATRSDLWQGQSEAVGMTPVDQHMLRQPSVWTRYLEALELQQPRSAHQGAYFALRDLENEEMSGQVTPLDIARVHSVLVAQSDAYRRDFERFSRQYHSALEEEGTAEFAVDFMTGILGMSEVHAAFWSSKITVPLRSDHESFDEPNLYGESVRGKSFLTPESAGLMPPYGASLEYLMEDGSIVNRENGSTDFYELRWLDGHLASHASEILRNSAQNWALTYQARFGGVDPAWVAAQLLTSPESSGEILQPETEDTPAIRTPTPQDETYVRRILQNAPGIRLYDRAEGQQALHNALAAESADTYADEVLDDDLGDTESQADSDTLYNLREDEADRYESDTGTDIDENLTPDDLTRMSPQELTMRLAGAAKQRADLPAVPNGRQRHRGPLPPGTSGHPSCRLVSLPSAGVPRRAQDGRRVGSTRWYEPAAPSGKLRKSPAPGHREPLS